MFRIDTSTAASSKPAYPAAGTEKYFQDTDPSGGTIVPAWFLNQIQEEIRKVITDAGLTPDKANDGQLSEAVRAIAAGTFSANTNGYNIFPGGLIIQWGTAPAIGSGTTMTVTFPVAFTTACYNAQATYVEPDAVDHSGPFIKSVNTTTLVIQVTAASAVYYKDVMWIAIGK